MSAAVAHAAAPQRSDSSEPVERRARDDAPVRLVLETLDGEPSGALAFGVIDLPLGVLEAAGRLLSSEDWKRIFSVHVAGEEVAPLLGGYRVTSAGVWLVPAFPPEPGLRYRAVFRPVVLAARLGYGAAPQGADEADRAAVIDLEHLALARMVRADLVLAAPAPREPTRVDAVHPGGSEVPENLLRFYVHFTAPMSRGSVHRWIRLEDARGVAIELPFLELAEELWDREGRRLTLLLDPGRIKLGLRPRLEDGPALEVEHQVFLVIDARWPDAAGRPLAAAARRGFRVGPADHEPIDPTKWRLTAPPAGARDPLRVELDESLDHALLHRLLWIEDADGHPVAGSIETGDAERTWSFIPETPWKTGSYTLRVDRRLEDLAGNGVGRPFEVDLTQRRAEVESSEDDDAVSLPFTVPTRGTRESRSWDR